MSVLQSTLKNTLFLWKSVFFFCYVPLQACRRISASFVSKAVPLHPFSFPGAVVVSVGICVHGRGVPSAVAEDIFPPPA